MLSNRLKISNILYFLYQNDSDVIKNSVLNSLQCTLIIFFPLASRKHKQRSKLTAQTCHPTRTEGNIAMYVNRTCSNLLYLCSVIFLFSLISLIGAHFITLSPIPFLLSKVYNIFMCYLISWLHLPCFIQQHRLLWSQLTFYASERSVGKKNLYKTTLDWLSEYNTKTPTDLLMFVARNHWLVWLVRYLSPCYTYERLII